jgi:predicted metal-dependent phosphoesterase TrpH
LRVDLHCHSTASDGTLSPVELIGLAKKENLWGLSITDHDTLDAYKTAIPSAEQQGIHLGTGIEFSCEHLGYSIHVLGYDYLLTDPGLKDLCHRHQKRRRDRNQGILEKLNSRGFVVDEEELFRLADQKTIGRPHIAQQMLLKGYVSSIQEAFTKYLAEGKSCYVPGTPVSVAETIGIIHEAQGKAFVAHPYLLPKKMPLGEILKLPFDGIECFYSRFSHEAARFWLKIAQEKNWLISGGSDFHGSLKPDISLGSSYVGKEEFEKIFEKPLT